MIHINPMLHSVSATRWPSILHNQSTDNGTGSGEAELCGRDTLSITAVGMPLQLKKVKRCLLIYF